MFNELKDKLGEELGWLATILFRIVAFAIVIAVVGNFLIGGTKKPTTKLKIKTKISNVTKGVKIEKPKVISQKKNKIITKRSGTISSALIQEHVTIKDVDGRQVFTYTPIKFDWEESDEIKPYLNNHAIGYYLTENLRMVGYSYKWLNPFDIGINTVWLAGTDDAEKLHGAFGIGLSKEIAPNLSLYVGKQVSVGHFIEWSYGIRYEYK